MVFCIVTVRNKCCTSMAAKAIDDLHTSSIWYAYQPTHFLVLVLALVGSLSLWAVSCSSLPENLHSKVNTSLLAWFAEKDPERKM